MRVGKNIKLHGTLYTPGTTFTRIFEEIWSGRKYKAEEGSSERNPVLPALKYQDCSISDLIFLLFAFFSPKTKVLNLGLYRISGKPFLICGIRKNQYPVQPYLNFLYIFESLDLSISFFLAPARSRFLTADNNLFL